MQSTKPMSKLMSGNWTDVFPATVETQEQSLIFVKKLLAIGVSNIMYMRSAFPGKSNLMIHSADLHYFHTSSIRPSIWIVGLAKGITDDTYHV